MKTEYFYEALPHIYIAIGTIAILGIDPQYGRFAGALLIFAGVLVTRMRLSYRKDQSK